MLHLECSLRALVVRADAFRFTRLLAPGFVEIGASGRRWGRAAILELLQGESGSDGAGRIDVHELEARVLGDAVVQVFWVSSRGGRRVRRTSLWQRIDGAWRTTYHQGTPL
nr:nuclear transport factor 2 family protein [Kytococcus schroeteri]